MYAAIQVLEKALRDSMLMQQSPEAASHINQLQMAINLLKKHTALMEKEIEKQLLQSQQVENQPQ